MSDISIRIATLEDVSNVAYLGKKTFGQSFGYLFNDSKDLTDYLDHTFSIEKLQKSIVKPSNIYWIVFYEDSAVGYAKIQLDAPSEFIPFSQVCKLQKLYILQEYGSNGIGARLHQLIFNKAITHYSQYIWLSVLKSNERATAFYKRDNYKIVGEHPFRIGKQDFDFWVMSKKL